MSATNPSTSPTLAATHHRPQVHDLLMLYRPLSHMVRLQVEREVQARMDDGRLTPQELPLQISFLRIVWGAPTTLAIVEINQEVNLKAQVQVTRAIAAGEQMTLADINPDECYLLPPEINGRRAAFYLGASLYLTFFTMFDFTPNGPGEPSDSPMRYPVAEILSAVQLAEKIRPKEAFTSLAAANWPPGREYYPSILLGHVTGTLRAESPEFCEAVATRYGPEHWNLWCGFWEEIKAFPSRLVYVKDAAQKYLAGDYIGAVRVAAPEFEGIMREHLIQCGVTPFHRQRDCLKQFRDLVLSRPFMMFPKSLLDLILSFIKRDLMKSTDDVTDPRLQVNRHGIAHGIFAGFESRDIALKYMILLDSLAFVVFHDRLVTGRL